MNFLQFLKNIFLLSFLASISVFSQNYEISVAMNTRNDTILLGHYFAKGDRMYRTDTLVLENGKGVFLGNRKLSKGVYFMINDGRMLFDLIIGDNQKFSIVADTADLINRTKFTSSPDNDVFFEFQRYNAERSRHFQQLNEQYKNATSDADKNEIRVKQQTLIKERIEFIENLADKHKDLFVSKFLKTLVPPNTHLPDPPRDDQGRITDSTYVYRWYRAHFFDNLNIYDPDMLRTQFYEEKLFDYITRVIPQQTDTVCAELDKILKKAQANDEIFRYILITVFNHYAGSKTLREGALIPENVKLHIAENWYIPFATWASEEQIKLWKEEVANNKMNRMDHPAPPIEPLIILPPEHFKAAALDTAIKNDLYAGRVIQDFRKELKSKFTLLFFWDISCGHCKTAIQELQSAWDELKNNDYQILAIQIVATKEAKGKWIDFINEHNMFGWINAWSPYAYSAENYYRETYNLVNVPKLYLLDENSIIVLKNIVPEQLKDIIPKK